MINEAMPEGMMLALFIHKYNLTTEFLDANYQWGKLVDGRWNGLVGNVS